jgi:aspartyl aminopeptidase
VIKTNVNQRYATDSVSAALMRIIAWKCEVPLQDFIVKNDSLCGSTIGPIIASKTGIKTVDIGAPMLGMHSIRETCGILDGYYYKKLFG